MIQKTYLFIYYIGEKFFKLQKIWRESGNFCKKCRRLLRRLRLLAMTMGLRARNDEGASQKSRNDKGRSLHLYFALAEDLDLAGGDGDDGGWEGAFFVAVGYD